MSRAYTVEEARENFITNVKAICDYWSRVEGRTELEKCEGVAFSILNIFDGTSACLPMMDIVLRPHPLDKHDHMDNDENYYEDGQVINDCYLHSIFNRSES